MGKYETVPAMAKALGVKPQEAVAAMKKADLHLPLSDADLKEIGPHLGRPVRKPRDPFRNAFYHAYLESLRRSIEHQEDTFATRWELFHQMKAPFANMKEAEAWIAQETERQGPVEDIDYLGKLSPYELWRDGKRPPWSSALDWRGDDGQERAVWVIKGGVLDLLREGSEKLAEKIGCAVHRATNHILADEVPLVPLIDMRPIFEGRNHNLTGFSIRVNYPWVPAELVADHYAAYKKVWTKGRPSPRAADVAVFLLWHSKLTWPEKWREWNRLNPDRRYSSWQALQAAGRRA